MTDMKLVVSIINYLKDECRRTDITEDTKESLEVAIQCLQTAYDLKPEDVTLEDWQTLRSLGDIFNDATKCNESGDTLLRKAEAERAKGLGNTLMKNDRNVEAVEAYSQAIKLDNSNAIYYCNRAAAYSRLSDFHNAVGDCEKAIALDPKYSKAYGRMGLAYSSLNCNGMAIECYKKAIELDPTNESYQTNLKIAEEKASKGEDAANPSNTVVDVTEVLGNPLLRNMASRMMQDPSMITLMSGLMSNSMNEGEGRGGMDALLQAGQQLAAQMQAANPQLIDQLRQHFSGNQPPQNSETKDQDN